MIVTILAVLATSMAITGIYGLGYYNANKHGKIAYAHLYQVSLLTLRKQNEEFTKAMYMRIRGKLDEVHKIMSAQLKLWCSVDGPNRGASHTRWKSGLIGQINDLETEKINAFRDIISNGVDITVQVMNSNGSKSEKKMSQLISEHELSTPTEPFTSKQPVKENDSNNKLRLVRPKLTLIKDSNNDKQPTNFN